MWQFVGLGVFLSENTGGMIMKTQATNIFRLTENTIKKIKYIKLTKKASYKEKELEKVIYNDGIGNRSTSIQFYSFGFYDSLTCVRPNEITSLAYQEHFLISYPFEKAANTSKVEQWFGILPLAEEKRYYSGIVLDETDDPFFCKEELQKEVPFIGVILVSLSNAAKESRSLHFEKLLIDYVEKITNIFGEIDKEAKKKRYIAEIYYSLNCSDLCVVIRTDEIPFVHRVNYDMRVKAEENEYGINTTVIFAVQDIADKDVLLNLAEKNKKVSFIVRSNEKYSDRSQGVNGIGRYVTKFKYEEYIKFLPQLFVYKLGKENDSDIQIEQFVKDICHEREWFVEEWTALPAAINKEDKLQEVICLWICDIHNEVIKIENLAAHIFSGSKELYGYEEIFAREMRLIKDLIYSYSDLWYQSASDSGFIFFAQLEIILQGLYGLMQEIAEIDLNDNTLEPSIEQLFEVIHCSVCDLNGYNKQFQFLNQDSVNFPNYEIQSKVNAEKYMAAYSSFLHKFFVLYYQNKEDDKHIVQNFPLALVDLEERKIVTNIFFSSLYKENTKKENKEARGIFAVHFPSSEYFSNLWNSIPLLMHEASHTQNYGQTIDRNNAVVYNMDMYIAEILTNRMLKYINEGIVVYTSSLLSEILKQKVYQAIKIIREDFFNKLGGFEYWGFKELLGNCMEFYSRISGKHNDRKNMAYSQVRALEERIRNDINYIMQVIGFDKICYALTGNRNCPAAVYYFANVLYLEVHRDFYLKYEKKYKEKFLKELISVIRVEENEPIEQEMLVCALYHFLKYVEKNSKSIIDYPEIVEENMSDSLAISFMMLLITGMRAIFERYCKGFIIAISEKEYYEMLIPNSLISNVSEYTKQLEEVYERYRENIKDDEALIHDTNLMRTMLYEYYELYVRVNNIGQFFRKDEFLVEDDRETDISNAFIECVYCECEKFIREEEDKVSFSAVFSQTNRELLVKLGLFEKGCTVLKDIYARICAEEHDSFIEEAVKNRKELFMEVYADCGMCCAMGFDPFVYCIFAMSIYKTVNDLNSMSPNSNFLADRMCSVVRMFFSDVDKKDWNVIFSIFLGKLCDVKMVKSICNMLLAIDEIDETEKIQEVCNKLSVYANEKFECDIKELGQLLKAGYNDILIEWKDDIIGQLIDIVCQYYGRLKDMKKRDRILVARTYLLRIYNVLLLIIQEEMLPHILKDNFDGFFQGVRKYIEENEGIKAIKNDKCVKEISRFYNMDCAESVEDKFEWYYTTYCGGFLTQCNFIFENYCDYRNAYDNLKSQIRVDNAGKVNLKIVQWFEKIDDYYRGVR